MEILTYEGLPNGFKILKDSVNYLIFKLHRLDF